VLTLIHVTIGLFSHQTVNEYLPVSIRVMFHRTMSEEDHVRFSTFALAFGALLCLAPPGLPDNCATIPGNLVSNCGFEDGTYTSTIPGLQYQNSDPGVPNFWRADPNFIEGYVDSNGEVGDVTSISGTDYLSIGTVNFGSLAVLTSTAFTTVSGQTYDGSLYIEGSGTFLVTFGNNFGGPVLFLNSGEGLYSFSFVGGGTEELTLAAMGGPWYVDDIVIAAASEVPEPRATFLIPVGVIACLLWLSRLSLPSSKRLRGSLGQRNVS
jgi:hypothetical protein